RAGRRGRWVPGRRSRVWSLRGWWPRPADIGAAGKDPDVRFSLANERTLLAWVRTSLALLAGGVAVVQLVPEFAFSAARHILGVPLILLGIAVAATSYRRWATVEQAMRERRSLPVSGLPRLLAVGVALVSVAALIFVLVAARGVR
nr:DUF202 domain-containing protein [Micromonospora sp. DSM 115978]